MIDYSIHQATNLLREAKSLCISSGAGMSAESGIPTFRDKDGVWSKMNATEMASPEGFARDPMKVWEWYRYRREELGKIDPHVGHVILAEWESFFRKITIVTQNVDGLHHRAGSTHIIELHGRLDQVRCTGCAFTIDGLDDLGPEPHCPKCNHWLRPGVVWFGEMLPDGTMDAAADAAEGSEILLLIGTSGEVYPAASLAHYAKDMGRQIIEINPKATPLSPMADVCIRQLCGEALTAINELLNSAQ